MSFVQTLGNRFVTYVDKATRDPEAEAEQKQQQSDLKTSQKKANKTISDASALLKKALTTPYTKTDNTVVLNYSIFPQDASDMNTILNNASIAVNAAPTSDLVNTYMTDNLGEEFENFKIKSIFNNQVYAKSGKFTKRFETWVTFRSLKQAIHDNPEAPEADKAWLNTYLNSVIKFLRDTKHTPPDDDKDAQVLLDDQSGLNVYNGNAITDTTANNKALSNVYLMIGNAMQKLKANHYEVDFNDSEGDMFTGNITPEAATANLQVRDREQDQFSVSNLIADTLNLAITVFLSLVCFFILLMGSSMAVNLNVHKAMPYRIFYAVYGLIFGLFVFIYIFIYKFWWLGIKPYYYGFMPIIPGFFINPVAQFFFGWLTFRPDKRVLLLQEWRNFQRDIPKISAIQ